MTPKDQQKQPGESDAAFLARLAQLKADERARAKGRTAILDTAEPWTPVGAEVWKPGATSGEKIEAADPVEPPRADHVMMPRFIKDTVKWVPVSMPEEPPITCLGRMGRTFYYLTPQGELVGLQDSEHGQAHIQGLWAPRLKELDRAFPQFDQARNFKGFQAQYARAAMMQACAVKPIFDAHERVRGLGCWKDDAGALVQHLGDRVLAGGQEHRPGEIDGFVYPGRPALPPPRTGGKADCEAIYQRMQLWNFERGEVDARLALGQLAAGVLGAAVDWRPMAFITGDAGSGKSTFQRMVRSLLPKRIISTVDASEAALRALLGHDALMVSFDEIEADAHNDKAQAVMKLARTSASGDDAHRSGQDQVARSFTLRGSFLFSAIVPPSMRQQDMQRFAFLRMGTLKKGAKLPALTSAEAKELGAGLVGRITEGWPRWERTLQAYFLALEQRGHEHRGAMQFGSMLAAAHILLHDREPDDEDFAKWCEPLHRDKLFEYENSAPAWLTAWRIILTSCPELWRTHGNPTVGEVIRMALVARGAEDGRAEYQKKLGWLNQVGLSIVQLRGTNKLCVAISPKHQALAGIFRGTDFQALGGEGAWNIPLRGAPRIDGDKGVLHVENVPRLGRQKCPLFWLDGSANVAGEWVKIFEASFDDDDQVTAPMAERLASYIAAIGKAADQAALTAVHGKAEELRGELSEEQLAAADAAFNDRWIELEPSPDAPEAPGDAQAPS